MQRVKEKSLVVNKINEMKKNQIQVSHGAFQYSTK